MARGSVKRVNGWLVAAGIVLAVAAAVYFVRDAIALATIGTGHAAKQTCSCLFVSGRSMDSCRTDYPPDTAKRFSWRVEGRTVKVSLYHLVSSTAVYEEGFGCHVAH